MTTKMPYANKSCNSDSFISKARRKRRVACGRKRSEDESVGDLRKVWHKKGGKRKEVGVAITIDH